MPNWSTNTIAIVGKKDAILSVINEGLRNSNEKEQTDLNEAFNSLVEKGKHKEHIVKRNDKGETISDVIDLVNGLTLRTWRPMPDTFFLYDTTNYPDKFKNEAEEQRKEYKCVGWYDYNCLTLGCKWDSEIDSINLYEGNDNVALVLTCTTPWVYPHNWLAYLIDKFDIRIFYSVCEESNEYNIVGEYQGNETDYGDFSEVEGCPNIDDDWEGYFEFVSDCQDNMLDEMFGIIENEMNVKCA